MQRNIIMHLYFFLKNLVRTPSLLRPVPHSSTSLSSSCLKNSILFTLTVSNSFSYIVHLDLSDAICQSDSQHVQDIGFSFAHECLFTLKIDQRSQRSFQRKCLRLP